MLPSDIPFTAIKNCHCYTGICPVSELSDGCFELETFSSALYLYSESGKSDIHVQMKCGKEATFQGVPNGIFPISVKKIFEEGSTPEYIAALY